MRLHLVSFQMPYPPDYGGVIDVYYKLKALRDAGCSVVLHTFIYGRDADARIADVADEVHYYRRRTGLSAQLSALPYIVGSRTDSRLLENLRKDDAPVLFEGLHTCGSLSRLAADGRCVMVRTHNVEHDYYAHLAESTGDIWQRVFFTIESMRLRRFERVLGKASALFAISEADADYFRRKFPSVRVVHIPPFFDDAPCEYVAAEDEAPDVLYHGNLEVAENEDAVKSIISEIMPLLSCGTTLTVAGRNPSASLLRVAADCGVRVIENPEPDRMRSLIASAKVNLLLSHQGTGVKLKLMNVLALARGYCVVNGNMLPDRALADYCVAAESPADIAAAVNTMLERPRDAAEAERSRRSFLMRYGNSSGAEKLLEAVSRCQNM